MDGVKKIHHINFLVKDLDQATALYEKILGMPATAREPLPSRGATTARFRVGDVWLVLVQPTCEEGIPAQLLKKNGEGFFLMSLEVDHLNEARIELAHEDILVGSSRRGIRNWTVADIEPVCGAQLQLTQEITDPGD